MRQGNPVFVPEITGYDQYSVLTIYILYSITKIITILTIKDTYQSKCVLDLGVYLVLYSTIELFDVFLLCALFIRKYFHLEHPPKMLVFSIQLSTETFRIMILVVATIDLIKEIECLHGAIEILVAALVCSEILKILLLIKPAHNFLNTVISAASYEYFDDITFVPHVNLEPYLKLEVSDGFCAICLSSQKTDEKWVGLPCKHDFHHICMKTWVTYKNSCPVCRSLVA
ncbi:unnamed protein product [Blepharisma stoltei]|uniref:RING-type E3 ubiquitin transferase n=1 Tax=Blepharisma stoltei TaxID=1481888 RepID=A0AAU9JYZ2_9CILI|nr:unnamed protein product [Blepharisma stoltei]